MNLLGGNIYIILYIFILASAYGLFVGLFQKFVLNTKYRNLLFLRKNSKALLLLTILSIFIIIICFYFSEYLYYTGSFFFIISIISLLIGLSKKINRFYFRNKLKYSLNSNPQYLEIEEILSQHISKTSNLYEDYSYIRKFLKFKKSKIKAYKEIIEYEINHSQSNILSIIILIIGASIGRIWDPFHEGNNFFNTIEYYLLTIAFGIILYIFIYWIMSILVLEDSNSVKKINLINIYLDIIEK